LSASVTAAFATGFGSLLGCGLVSRRPEILARLRGGIELWRPDHRQLWFGRRVVLRLILVLVGHGRISEMRMIRSVALFG